jgi:cytochrome c5
VNDANNLSNCITNEQGSAFIFVSELFSKHFKSEPMKRNYLYIMLIMAFPVLTVSVLSPAQFTNNKSTTQMTIASIPDDVEQIFKNSCMYCHASGGKSIPMAKLNFSNWDNYKPGKQVKKAVAICKLISKGAMPPKLYREDNPEANLSAYQKELICKWSETFSPRK